MSDDKELVEVFSFKKRLQPADKIDVEYVKDGKAVYELFARNSKHRDISPRLAGQVDAIIGVTNDILRKSQRLLRGTVRTRKLYERLENLEGGLQKLIETIPIADMQEKRIDEGVEEMKRLKEVHDTNLDAGAKEMKRLQKVHEKNLDEEIEERKRLQKVHEKNFDEEIKERKRLQKVYEKNLDKEIKERKRLEKIHEKNLDEEIKERKRLEKVYEKNLDERIERMKRLEEVHEKNLDEEIKERKRLEKVYEKNLDERVERMKRLEEVHEKNLNKGIKERKRLKEVYQQNLNEEVKERERLEEVYEKNLGEGAEVIQRLELFQAQQIRDQAVNKILLNYGDYIAERCSTYKKSVKWDTQYSAKYWSEIHKIIQAEQETKAKARSLLQSPPRTPMLDHLMDISLDLKVPVTDIIWDISAYAATNEFCHTDIAIMAKQRNWICLAQRTQTDYNNVESLPPDDHKDWAPPLKSAIKQFQKKYFAKLDVRRRHHSSGGFDVVGYTLNTEIEDAKIAKLEASTEEASERRKLADEHRNLKRVKKQASRDSERASSSETILRSQDSEVGEMATDWEFGGELLDDLF
ncbi:hypothetical protein EAF04_004458 [Stromatinia cepivora]|nr:hypothetical protein EAF04_004458 [Stromatinia cepivora]